MCAHRTARVQKYELFFIRQRKLLKNLEVKEKLRMFATSNIKFDYPVNVLCLETEDSARGKP
jgi:hypothetical protein